MKTKSLLLTFLLLLSMLSTAWADEIITIVADGQTISDATTWENSTVNITGSGKVTFSKRIIISGDVTLNISAGATLKATIGITVSEGNSLTIAGDGSLTAGAYGGDYHSAAIGGTENQNSGTINITGGTISATGRGGGAGIGGGDKGSATIINISGGNVTATGSNWSAGIGGGNKGSAGTITITSGVVNATGAYKGAGIGGGGDSNNPGGGGTISISGGQVTATGGKDSGNPCGHGIGPGKGSSTEGTSGTISLSWTESTDFISASSYKGTISFEDRKRFYYDETTDFVTADELANKLNQKIVPAVANNNSLEFADIQMPRYYITTNGTAVDVNYDVYDYDGNKLMLGTHYTAVIKNSGNEDVTTFDQLGDYTLTVTGTGTTYTGSKSFTFSLVEWDSNLSVDGSDHYINFPSDGTKKTVYLGKNQTIKVYDSEGKNGNLVPSDGRLMLYAPEGYALEVTGKTDAEFYASAQYWTWLKAYDGNDETETALITKIDQNSDNISFGSAADGMIMRFYVYKGQSGATEKYGLDLTVRVVEATPHNITVETADNGSIASDKTSAKTNETITLTVNPANGYLLKRITVTDTDNGTTIATIGEDHWYSGVNTVTLQMPNKNITVTPEYAHVLTIDDGLTLNIDPTRTIDYVIPDGVASFKIAGFVDNGNAVTVVLKAPSGVHLLATRDYEYFNYNREYIDCDLTSGSYINIYDGASTSSPLMKTLNSGDETIGAQTSSSNYMTFEIHGGPYAVLRGRIEMVYSITYDLAGGSVAIENPVTYTYATAHFTLNNPSKDGYEFAGWTGTGLDDASTNVTIAKGSYGNREYTATWKKLLTNSDITIAAIPDQTYTGLAIEPEVTVTDGETPLTLGTDYTVSYSANINVGTATATITGIGDYSGTVEKTFEITPKEITVIWGNQTSFVYNGTEQAPTATAEGLVDGDECLITVSGAKDVGSYTAKAVDLSNSNYKLPTENLEKTFEITPKEISIVWGGQTLFYSGTEQAPTATAKGLVSDDICLITVSGAKDVGIHTATVTALSNSNYKLPTENLETQFEIKNSNKTTDLSSLTNKYTAQDGETLTGTLTKGYYKISIAKGATVILNGVTINKPTLYYDDWAGITCEGDCNIILAENSENIVKSFNSNYPGISIPEGSTLTILGAGSLEAINGQYGAGIGAPGRRSCGNIVILGGTITATGGLYGAGIGGANMEKAGNITILGGTITAIGGKGGSGIGGGQIGNVGNIIIGGDETKVTATKGEDAPYSIGRGKDGNRDGKIIIGGIETPDIETSTGTFKYPYLMLVYEDGNGKHAVLNGEYDGTDAVNISEDIENVAVTFDREFTPNSGHATIMFPFDVKASSLTGVRSVIEFDGVKTDKNDNKTVGVRYVWCNATLGEQEELNKHPNCNGYSGELKAYTPYMIEMESATLGIKDAVTLKSNSGKIVGDAPVGNWVFRGTLQKKEWPKGTGIINEGRLWAFSAAERSGAKIGEFVQFGGNNWANPFRAYLVECKKSGEDSWDCQDDSEPQPKASQVSKYRFADALAPTNSAEKLAGAVATDQPLVLRQAAASETASLNSMDIVIVYGDKDSDKERPTVIGRFNPATGEIRMLPRTKQTYDLKGRKVGNGKKAKGAYYRR